jgi:hypothetical protein
VAGKKRINRREFLISTATAAGIALPGLSWSASRPCPPPGFGVDGGTTRTTACSRPASRRFPILTLDSLAPTGTHGWTFGQPFIRGAVTPAALHAASGASAFQADVRNLWDDGSVKFAVLSGVSAFSDGTAAVALGESGVRTTGASVTEPAAAWLAENVVVTLNGDGDGTYTPAAARSKGRVEWNRATPHKVREILGPVMSEFHYYSPTSDDHVTIWWYVRAYSTGAVEVETVLENGWLNVADATHRKYGVKVTIGGVEKYATPMIGMPFWLDAVRSTDTMFRYPAASVRAHFLVGNTIRFAADPSKPYTVTETAFVSGGTDVTVDKALPEVLDGMQVDGHNSHTRWSRVDWVGTDPGITPRHDGDYLMASKFVPNYYKADGPPPEKTLNALKQASAPFEKLDWPNRMGAPGSNAEPVTRWDVFYVKTNGDIRAFRSSMAHARAAGRYGFHYRDETTGEPPLYSAYPRHGYGSAAPFSTKFLTAGTTLFPTAGTQPPNYAKSHAPQFGYFAYLLTGRHSFRETVEFQAQVAHWACNSAHSFFEGSRIAVAGLDAYSPRGAAWAIRTFMAAIVCVPDSEPRAAQYRAQLGKTLAYYDVHFTEQNALGVVQPNSAYGGQEGGYTAIAGFQNNYFTIASAWAYQLAGHQLGDDRPRAERFVNWRMKQIVGIMGTEGGYCYRDAAVYAPVYASEWKIDPSKNAPAEFNASVYKTWREVYERTALERGWTHDLDDCKLDNVLRGESGASPNVLAKDTNSYWALTQAALAFAVDLGAPGSTDAWARLVNARNYNPTGFRSLPEWGIVPRT